MNQNISKNVKDLSFNPPPLVTQPKFRQQSVNNYPPSPPPPKMNNRFDIPPKINYFNPPPLVRQSAYNTNTSENKLDYVDYMIYITYGFIIMFVIGLIMSGISYLTLNNLQKNDKDDKDNKDNIAKWNQIFFISMILVMIPLLILLFMVCSKSPLSCLGLSMIR